jgi:hypothetical protein
MLSGTPPAGLALSTSGTISGTPTIAGTSTFTVKVNDTSSGSATQTFRLKVISAGTLTRSGVLAHIAAGAGWTTEICLINTSASPVGVTIALHGDNGDALNSTVVALQEDNRQTITTASLDAVVNPNTTLSVSMGGPGGSTVVGWADIDSSGPLNGFAIFRQASLNGTVSEGTAPLLNRYPSKFTVPFDNTSGFVTAVAIAALSQSSSAITATAYDSNGTQLGTQRIELAANGHTSFAFPEKLEVTGGKQGIVVFQSVVGGEWAGLGLRFSPSGSFTSLPAILE